MQIGRRCVHAGPLALAFALALVTGAAALSNPSCPLWLVIVAVVFWPLVSILGQLL